MSELDYEKDRYIDESQLDIEWLEQAGVAKKYGEHWAFLKKKVALCEENVKVTRSELIAKAHKNPIKWLGKGNPKATAQPVEAFYRTDPDYIEAKEEHLEAIHDMDIAEIAYKEMSYTRKAALENLVKLHGQNYFAGPSSITNITERRQSREDVSKRTNKKVRISRRRK